MIIKISDIINVITNDKFNYFLNDKWGVTAIEYALIAFLISVVIVVAITALGNQVFNLYINMVNNLVAAF